MKTAHCYQLHKRLLLRIRVHRLLAAARERGAIDMQDNFWESEFESESDQE